MARSPFTGVTSAAAGSVVSAPAAVDAANGNEFTNNGRALIEITNGGTGSPITATIITNGTYSVGSVAYAIADLAVSIASGVTKVCGPFDTTLFNSATGTVQIDWSSGTSMTARVITLGTA